MRTNIHRFIRRAPSLGFALAAVVMMSACSQPYTGGANYAENHPLTVEKQTFVVAVPFTQAQTGLSRQGSDRVLSFAREYHRRGNSQMLVSTAPGSDSALSQDRLVIVRNELKKAGVTSDKIVLKPGTSTVGDRNSVILSFRGYAVKVPKCGDWSGETTFRPRNLPHSNYGCSYQRNIGLMISNPRDLLRSMPLGTGDPYKSTQGIKSFQEGEATGTDAPKEEDTGL